MDTHERHERHEPARQAAMLAAFMAVAIATGLVGSLLQGDDVGGRYVQLDRPAWAPPEWVFGVVWPVLYVLIGVAAWWLWRRAGPIGALRVPLGLWGAQLLVNAVWPGVFFGLNAYWAAAPVIVVLVILVAATIVTFARRTTFAAALLVPYLLWISYATALNVAIAVAN